VRFFTELGEQADAEIEDRYLEYAGPDIPGESAEDKQVRLTRAMNRASEELFTELVTPSPASQGWLRRLHLDPLGRLDLAPPGYRLTS
jgi:hypothetical protein